MPEASITGKVASGIENAVAREPTHLNELSCTSLAVVNIKDTYICMVLGIVRFLRIKCCAKHLVVALSIVHYD